MPLVPAGPQDLGRRPPWRRLSILRLIIHGLRSLTRLSGWGTLARTLVLAGCCYACWLGLYAAYQAINQRFRTRTIGVCVVTDFSYRADKPDWKTSLPFLFAEVNRMFEGTGGAWKAWDGGDAYPAETRGDILQRATRLASRADVVLGLTGQPDSRTSSMVRPFAHTLLVEDTAANTPVISATLIARSLTQLFGVPGNTQALILADAPGGIFDSSTVGIIRAMRLYDFAAGVSALSGGMERRAVSALTDALTGKQPHADSQAHVIIGRAFGAGMRYDDAVRHFGEAVRLDPQNASLHFEYGMALEEDSRADDAIAPFEDRCRLRPFRRQTVRSHGRHHLNRRRIDEAVDELREATRLDPHNASYQAVLGQALSKQPGGIREASAAFEEAMRLKPTQPGALAGLTRENGVEQNLLVAIRQMESEVSQKPASAAAHLKLGVAEAYAGNAESARKEIQRALQLDPRDGRAHLALARLDYMSGQYREAASELDAARAAGARPSSSFAEAIRRKVGN